MLYWLAAKSSVACARARFKTPTLTDSAVCIDLHTLTGDLGVVKAGVYLTTSCQPRFRSLSSCGVLVTVQADCKVCLFLLAVVLPCRLWNWTRR